MSGPSSSILRQYGVVFDFLPLKTGQPENPPHQSTFEDQIGGSVELSGVSRVLE
jgi:hypothetical protein